MDYKQEFLEIFQDKVHRNGARRMLEWLAATDFFTAPAKAAW